MAGRGPGGRDHFQSCGSAFPYLYLPKKKLATCSEREINLFGLFSGVAVLRKVGKFSLVGGKGSLAQISDYGSKLSLSTVDE